MASPMKQPVLACLLCDVAALQGGIHPSRHHRGAAALRQEAVRLGLPPRHGRPHEPDRPHVLPGSRGHGHHRLHAAVLQVQRAPPAVSVKELQGFHELSVLFQDSSCCGVLAVGESVLQRSGQLHESERRLPHHS